jgi:hypothetical protein
MIIVVFIQAYEWDYISRVPVMSDFRDKIKVFLSKQKLVLPIFLIFQSNSLLDWMLCI